MSQSDDVGNGMSIWPEIKLSFAREYLSVSWDFSYPPMKVDASEFEDVNDEYNEWFVFVFY